MPKAASIQEGFNSGEVSPIYYGRTSSDRYKESMGTCLNWLPTLQGPVIRRPGFKNLIAVKDSTKPPVLIPFVLSVTQAYMLEFGDGYIRFYVNNGQVVNPSNYYQVIGNTIGNNYDYNSLQPTLPPYSSGTLVTGPAVLELPSPYSYTDALSIKFAQNKNTLYLVHPAYAPMKLTQQGTYQWDLAYVACQDGPYLPLNTINTLADGAAITMVPSGTGTAINVQAGPVLSVNSMANNGSGAIRVQTTAAHGYSSGQKVFISGTVGTTEANNGHINTSTASWTINVANATNFDLIGSTFVHTYVSGGTVQPAFFNSYIDSNLRIPLGPSQQIGIQASDGMRYYGYITGAGGPGSSPQNVSNFTVFFSNGLSYPNTTATSFWYLGTWTPRTVTSGGVTQQNGAYPSCVSFHQDRLGFAGANAAPEEIDLSMTAQYEVFSANAPQGTNALQVAANNAIQFSLLSRDVNAIRWLSSATQGLLAGTYESEWTVSPSANYDALTPTNVNALQTSYFGCANVDSVRCNNATLYVQRSGRKLREMNFFFQVGTFRSTDLSELSEHLTLAGVTKLAVQKETQPTVWALTTSGQLLSMTYNRDDLTLKAGWARHTIGGQSDAAGSPPNVWSMGVIPDPSTTFDQMWAVIGRWINGTFTYYIEYMTKAYDDSIRQDDAFQCDGGSTYFNPVGVSGISIASTAVITATGHGFSNGFLVKFIGVAGVNMSSTDVNGNVTTTNLVNEKVFTVAGVTTNTFTLLDSNGNAVSSAGYSAYIFGGAVCKLVTTISGLTYLENETVNVLADGTNHPPVVVSNSGVITLQYPAAKVQIGYWYNSDGQLLRTEAGSAEGTSIGQTRRVNRIAMMMHKVGDILWGMSFGRLIPAQFTRADVNQADSPAPLFSGIHRDGVESEYDFEGQFCFRVNSGLPAMVNAITVFLEEQDV